MKKMLLYEINNKSLCDISVRKIVICGFTINAQTVTPTSTSGCVTYFKNEIIS